MCKVRRKSVVNIVQMNRSVWDEAVVGIEQCDSLTKEHYPYRGE